MTKLISWFKSNKLTVILIIAVGYLLWKQNYPGPVYPLLMSSRQGINQEMAVSGALPKAGGGFIPPVNDIAPTDTTDRMVIKESTMSLMVKDVAESIKTIQGTAEKFGGFLINSHISKPQESGSGSISVRVPEAKLTETLAEFRKAGLRVTDEYISGLDVTDQYVDLEARLATLNKTKVKFEEILDRATQVQDLLNAQRELINLQQQIDSIKGQQQYLSQSAKLSRITVYLSTDEFSLPYSPTNPWRPNVVFKLAVRSLVSNLRNLGSALIWIVVYSPIWIPILIVVWFFSRRKKS
ncbi:DUF4349 domain-containing protein [Candidatus Collierbacteria bacterium]|nr:DUF4349 domain-containing protein [Candidatus Collierbacteria bacterium]